MCAYYREGRLYHPRLEENVFELQQQAKRPDWWLSVGSVRLHVNVRVRSRIGIGIGPIGP